MRPIRKRNYLAILFCLVVSCGSPAPDFEPLITAEDERRADDPALQTAAQAGDPLLRARAATAYGRIGKPACIDPLLALLSDQDPAVLSAASFALGQFTWHTDSLQSRAPEIVSRLQPLLLNQDEGVRRSAVEAIGKLAGDGAAMLLSAALKDPAAAVRAETALALFRAPYILRLRDPMAKLSPLPHDTLQLLREVAAQPDEGVRRAVLYLFARFKDDRFSDLLPLFTRDPDLWVRLFAVQALKRAGDGSMGPVQALVQATGDAEYEVRLAAVQALIALKHPEAVPVKLAMDPSHHVRAAAADAYALSTPGDETLLMQLFGDPSLNVKAAALRNLVGLRKAAAGDLINMALAHESWVIRAAAVDASAALGKDAEPILMNTIKDQDEHVRVSTLSALATIQGPWAFTAIKAALMAPGLAERGTAVDSLGQRKEPERLAAAWACYQASSGRRWNDIRDALVDVFAQVPGAESEGYLRMVLADPVPSIVSKAEKALMDRGATGLPALPPLSLTHSPYRAERFSQNPVVLMKTTRGDLEIECYAQEAPIHVASFVGLVKQGYYDGLLWHRVVPNFVIQGGDKEGSGWGDAGYSLRAEINGVRFDRGTLGMPRSADFDSGGSQVFFNHVPTPHLDSQYTVFGQVRRGLEVIDLIEEGDVILKATLME